MVVHEPSITVKGRLKAMTSTQMDFLGLKEFKFDEKAQDVNMVLYVDSVGDVPIQIQLRNRRFNSAKACSLLTNY